MNDFERMSILLAGLLVLSRKHYAPSPKLLDPSIPRLVGAYEVPVASPNWISGKTQLREVWLVDGKLVTAR